MIKRPNNWNEVREFSDRPKLPLGAYVCKVKQAVVQSNDYGDQLCILFDIVEGEYKDFFMGEFRTNNMENKKWKGILKQWCPKDDGSEKDEWTKSSFKGMVTSFEKSNPGYQWNWDEASLVGKVVGILFRNEEWDFDGKHGWAVRPFKALSVDAVRNGEFTIPNDKPLKNKVAAPTSFDAYTDLENKASMFGNQTTSFSELDEDDGELPF